MIPFNVADSESVLHAFKAMAVAMKVVALDHPYLAGERLDHVRASISRWCAPRDRLHQPFQVCFDTFHPRVGRVYVLLNGLNQVCDHFMGAGLGPYHAGQRRLVGAGNGLVFKA